MRIKNLKPYVLKHREIILDKKEGGRREVFSQEGVPIRAYIYDDTQSVQSTMGGIQFIAVKTMLLDAPGLVCERDPDGQEGYVFHGEAGSPVRIGAGDGICVYTAPENRPDYRIASIVQEGHLVCRLERI